jgi:hypothetical protein
LFDAQNKRVLDWDSTPLAWHLRFASSHTRDWVWVDYS